MKKILMVLLLVFIAIFFFNCKTDPVPGDSGDAGDAGDVGTYEVLGAYLKIESTGMYFNELLNTNSSEAVTLETIVNLRDEPTSDRRSMNQGFFGSGGGITFSTTSGLNPQGVGCDGTAHVNGFISKGPFNEGSAVTITLIDENLNEIPIDTEFLSQLDGETNTMSTFSIDLSATEDIDIPTNVNLLTALQSARVDSLAADGMSYADAYEQAKSEVLAVFNLESETGNIEEFESINLTDNTNGGAALLVASSVVLNDNTGGRSVTDFIDSIKNDVAENGTLTNETLADTLSENIQNTDFTAIVNNLQTYYDDLGETVDVPETNDFEDNDGDNVPNQYDIDLTAPMGFADNTLPTLQWEYNGGLTDHEYLIQVSVSDDFIPSQTSEYTSTGTSYTLTEALNSNQTYYWRVSVSYNNVPLYWPASTSFTTSSSSELPYGGFVIEGGIASTPTRVVTLDNSGVIGATEMRFSNDGTFDPNDLDWTGFELTKSWILTEGLGEKTVYAEFRNTNGTIPMSQSITYDNQSYPTGSFVINNDAPETSNTAVTLDLSGISGAFKMRFSNDGVFDTAEEAWVDFSSEYNWTLTDGAGEKTVTGEFKNSQGTNLNNPAPNNEPITDTITLVDVTTAPTGTFSISEHNITTNNITVTLDLSGILGADEMYFSDDGTVPTDTDYYPYSSNYTFTLSTMDTSHTIAGYFKNTQGEYDTSANVSYYSLTLTVNNDTYGSVIVQPDLPVYSTGTEIVITPIPDAGSDFTIGGTTGGTLNDNGDGTYSITVGSSNITVSGEFSIPSAVLTINAGANGAVTNSGTNTILLDTPFAIEATPEASYMFINWTVTSGTGVVFDDSSSATTNVTLTSGDATIQANFEAIPTEMYVDVNYAGGNSNGTSTAPFTDIQIGIDQAITLGLSQVRVALGSYNVTAPVYVNQNISLYGGWSHDGAGNWTQELYQTEQNRIDYLTEIVYTGTDLGATSDPASAVVFDGSAVTNSTQFRGFTVRVDSNLSRGYVSAIKCINGTDVYIESNTIDGSTGNNATYGIFINTSKTLIHKNVIYGGEGGSGYGANGVYIKGSSNSIIRSNTIITDYSTYTDKGVYTGSSLVPKIDANDIKSDTGIYHMYSVAEITNNVIEAGFRGIEIRSSVYNTTPYSSSLIINNTIWGSGGSSRGIDIYSYYSAHSLNRPVIINNLIGNVDYGVYESSASVSPSEMKNNSIFMYTTGLYYDYDTSTTIGSLTDLHNLTDIPNGCSGNIVDTPAFVSGTDYHLTASTPITITEGGLDAASLYPSFPQDGSSNGYDKDFMLRTVPWSMGAYEY